MRGASAEEQAYVDRKRVDQFRRTTLETERAWLQAHGRQ